MLLSVGILSRDRGPEQHALRQAIRETWLPELNSHRQVAANFVVRVSDNCTRRCRRAIKEAETHGDMLVMTSSSDLDDSSGALKTLLSWYACAFMLWPSVQLIGKAEDDVWIHSSGVIRDVRSSLGQLRSYEHLYWGSFETYHWSHKTHAPDMWKWYYTKDIENCSDARYDANSSAQGLWAANPHPLDVIGPFAFAKVCALLGLARRTVRRTQAKGHGTGPLRLPNPTANGLPLERPSRQQPVIRLTSAKHNWSLLIMTGSTLRTLGCPPAPRHLQRFGHG